MSATGILWLCFWQGVGMLLCLPFFAEKRPLVRLWLGSVFGSVLSMWTPVFFAFFLGFSPLAHAMAALLGSVLLFGWITAHRKRGFRTNPEAHKGGDRPLLFLLIPFFALWVFLVWSHTLRPVDGALYTGQSTYGDMAMHLGFITSMAEQQTFPPFYSILPGTRISYPFLCDSVSASLYLLGTPLRWAYILPMLVAFLQFACGFWFLAREVCREKGAPVLAFLFFFLNGGLGMIYFIKDHTLRDLFTGFYVTPTNLTEKGMRWVNVIADMLLPQRATLFGWAVLTGALYLLFRAVFRGDEKCFLPAGLLGGALPMIHTHSFLALGLVAACWMAWSAFRDRLSRRWWNGWLRFGLVAVALAIPQLCTWTFRSVGGNASFLRLHFDWVNNGEENFFWFWLKNVGPLFLIAPLAAIFGDTERRALFSGPVLIFLLSEIVVFQPNVYDNNKLLYAGYFFCCFISADAVLAWLGRLPSRRTAGVLLAVLLLLTTNAALFTLGREAVSGIPRYGYELFSADEVAAADHIRENTAPDAVFLTDDNHDQPVAVLTGRNIVCGSGSFLYYHGLDYGYQQQTAEAMLTDSAAFEAHRRELNVDYVYMGPYERAMAGEIGGYLEAHYPAVYSGGSVTIYDVRD